MADYESDDVVIKKLDVSFGLVQEMCRKYIPSNADELLNYFSKAYKTVSDAVDEKEGTDK